MTAEAISPQATSRADRRWLSRDWLPWLGLVLPMVLLTILALRDLDMYSLWRDEVSSVVFAKGSLGDLLTIIGRDRQEVGLANMATYYLILHFWLLLGENEATIRLLSVIFGVASVVPVFFVARRIGGWLAAGLAAGIFVLIPFVIHYNQEARGYSLAILLAAAMTWLLLIGIERREQWWPWLAYGVLAALGLYVHFFLALVVAAHGLWVLATRQVPPWRSTLTAVVPFALAVAPMPFIVAEFGAEHGWIPPLNVNRVLVAMQKLAGGPLLLIALPTLLAIGAVIRRRDPRYWLLVASTAGPVLAVIAVSLVKPMLIPRYLVVVLPSLAVAAGVTLAVLRPPLLRAPMAAGLAVALLVSLPNAYFTATNIDWRTAGRWLAEEAEPGDKIVMQSWRDSPLDYYMQRSGPSAILERIGFDEARAGQEDRVWLALFGLEEPAVSQTVAELLLRYDVLEKRTFGPRATIFLLRPL